MACDFGAPDLRNGGREIGFEARAPPARARHPGGRAPAPGLSPVRAGRRVAPGRAATRIARRDRFRRGWPGPCAGCRSGRSAGRKPMNAVQREAIGAARILLQTGRRPGALRRGDNGVSASLPISSTISPSAAFQDLCQRAQRARSESTERPGRLFRYWPEPAASGARVARSNSASSMASAGSGGAGHPIRVPVAERARASNSRTPSLRPAGRAMRREGVERGHALAAGQQIQPRKGKREALGGAGRGDAQEFGIVGAQFDPEAPALRFAAAAGLRPEAAGTGPRSRRARTPGGTPARAPPPMLPTHTLPNRDSAGAAADAFSRGPSTSRTSPRVTGPISAIGSSSSSSSTPRAAGSRSADSASALSASIHSPHEALAGRAAKALDRSASARRVRFSSGFDASAPPAARACFVFLGRVRRCNSSRNPARRVSQRASAADHRGIHQQALPARRSGRLVPPPGTWPSERYSAKREAESPSAAQCRSARRLRPAASGRRAARAQKAGMPGAAQGLQDQRLVPFRGAQQDGQFRSKGTPSAAAAWMARAISTHSRASPEVEKTMKLPSSSRAGTASLENR